MILVCWPLNYRLPDMSKYLLRSIFDCNWDLVYIESWFWYWNILTMNKKFSLGFIAQQLGRRNCLYCQFETIQTLFDFFFDLSCFFTMFPKMKSTTYRPKHIFNRKGSDWNSAGKASHYVGFDCVSFLGRISNGTPSS